MFHQIPVEVFVFALVVSGALLAATLGIGIGTAIALRRCERCGTLRHTSMTTTPSDGQVMLCGSCARWFLLVPGVDAP